MTMTARFATIKDTEAWVKELARGLNHLPRLLTSTFAVRASSKPEGPSKNVAWMVLTTVTRQLAEKMLKSNFRMLRGIFTPQSSRSGTRIRMPSEEKSAEWRINECE